MTPLPHFIAGTQTDTDYDKIEIEPFFLDHPFAERLISIIHFLNRSLWDLDLQYGNLQIFVETTDDDWYWIRQIKDNRICWYNTYMKEERSNYNVEAYYEGELFDAMEKKYRHYIREKKLKRILE